MKTIKQIEEFKATPHEVYEALMDSKKHAEFTGADATVSRNVQGSISAWDGYVSGKNIELIPDKKIVQEWRASDWPKGAISTVTFEFEKTKKGTRMTFTHEGVPKDFCKSIAQGWIDHYWTPMRNTYNW